MSKIADMALQMGGNAINGVVGNIMGLMMEKHNDKRQIRQQQKLQDMQESGQRRMMDYSMMKQMEMWENTGYGAQKEQMLKAGLNPGLMYGMGGGGGTTTGSPSGSVTGGSAPSGGGEMMGMGIQMMNMQLMRAQKENIEAQTEKTKAETGNVPLTGKNIEASTDSLKQGIESSKSQQALTVIETKIKEIQKTLDEETLYDKMNMLATQLNILSNDNAVSSAVVDTKVEIIRQELANAISQNELIKKQAEKTGADTQQLAKELQLKWAQLENEQDKTKIQKALQEFETSFGGQAANILGTLLNLLPKKGGKGITINNK